MKILEDWLISQKNKSKVDMNKDQIEASLEMMKRIML